MPLDAFVPQEPKEKNEPKEVQVSKNIQKKNNRKWKKIIVIAHSTS